MSESKRSAVVVGGGLAGLTSAVLLAQRGFEVDLLEGAGSLGGRARTDEHDGFFFNMGPHALYAEGEGRRILQGLEVPCTGPAPAGRGMYLERDGRLHLFPAGIVSLMRTSALGWSQKLEMARFLGAVAKLDVEPWRGRTVNEYLAAETSGGAVADLLRGIVRLTTYVHDPDRQEAAAALSQLKLALSGNVLYLDGGWQTMIAGLQARALAAGVRLHLGAGAAGVRRSQRGLAVERDGGESFVAEVVLLATDPATALRLADAERAPGLAAQIEACVPVRAACLDLALSQLPAPERDFGLGLDQPLYFSVHSASARLAPGGAALVHVAKYLAADERPVKAEVEADLEGFMDRLQPGWREHVVHRRTLPAMTVVHDLHRAGGSPVPSRVTEVEGLWLAGDWVGERGMLADRALASAEAAVDEITAASRAKKAA